MATLVSDRVRACARGERRRGVCAHYVRWQAAECASLSSESARLSNTGVVAFDLELCATCATPTVTLRNCVLDAGSHIMARVTDQSPGATGGGDPTAGAAPSSSGASADEEGGDRWWMRLPFSAQKARLFALLGGLSVAFLLLPRRAQRRRAASSTRAAAQGERILRAMNAADGAAARGGGVRPGKHGSGRRRIAHID